MCFAQVGGASPVVGARRAYGAQRLAGAIKTGEGAHPARSGSARGRPIHVDPVPSRRLGG